ncbi:MAG: hypothetical protein WBP55_10170, partial [Solirubrobacterales bacterium]
MVPTQNRGPKPVLAANRGRRRGAAFSLFALLALLVWGAGPAYAETAAGKNAAAIDLRFIESAAIRGQGPKLSAATSPNLKEARQLEAETGAKSMKPLVAGISQAT